MDCKEIKPVHPKGNQSWISIGRTDVEAETPILWPPNVKSWLIGKEPDAGKDWRQEEKGEQRMRWLVGITDWMDMSLSKLWSWWWTGKPGVLQSMESQRVGHDWVTELNWKWLKIVSGTYLLILFNSIPFQLQLGKLYYVGNSTVQQKCSQETF